MVFRGGDTFGLATFSAVNSQNMHTGLLHLKCMQLSAGKSIEISCVDQKLLLSITPVSHAELAKCKAYPRDIQSKKSCLSNCSHDLCKYERERERAGFYTLHPVSVCRKLTIYSASSLNFEQQPLVSFEWHHSPADSIEPQTMQLLASLTTLTHLGLSNIPYQRGAEALRSLSNLRRLSLRDCNYMELDLFASGAFHQLTHLCIREHMSPGYTSYSQSKRTSTAEPYYLGVDEQRVSKAQEAILGISTLRELRGNPCVFEDWFIEGQRRWNLSQQQDKFVVWQRL